MSNSLGCELMKREMCVMFSAWRDERDNVEFLRSFRFAALKVRIDWEISANEKRTDLMRKYASCTIKRKLTARKRIVPEKKSYITCKSFVYISIRRRYETEISNMYIDRSCKYLLPHQSSLRKSVIFCD